MEYVLQKEETCEQQYLVLNVKEDNVRMSEFIRMHPNIKLFENGRAFYEFTEEDLDTYKEVVCATSDQLEEVNITYCSYMTLWYTGSTIELIGFTIIFPDLTRTQSLNHTTKTRPMVLHAINNRKQYHIKLSTENVRCFSIVPVPYYSVYVCESINNCKHRKIPNSQLIDTIKTVLQYALLLGTIILRRGPMMQVCPSPRLALISSWGRKMTYVHVMLEIMIMQRWSSWH